MNTNENKDLENRLDNNSGRGVNEGFSGQNISDDYDPSKEKLDERLRTETESDKNGNLNATKRARFTDENTIDKVSAHSTSADNSEMRTPTSVENRDHNSDVTSKRYTESHPDNHQNRGNMELDE